MGTWGVKLYQDDITCDIRDRYKEKLHKGKTDEDATKEIIEENQEFINDRDAAPLFWFALADTQWNLGRLESYVKEAALKHIETGENLNLWKLESPKELKQRKLILEKLKEKLISNQPQRKKISKSRLYKCPWKIGDTFAYRLESEYAKKENLLGRYLILQKVDETTWGNDHIIPIVRVKITKDNTIPKNINEFNELEYVQISSTDYADRFLPLNGLEDIKTQIERKSKINYVVDEYGFLPVYLLEIIITSTNQMNKMTKTMKFIGNYKDVLLPKNEFVPHSKVNIQACKCNEIESYILNAYTGHNLRRYEFYKKTKP